MKQFLLRVENWLVIIPIILLLIEITFLGHAAFDLHLHDTYIVIANSYTGEVMLLLVLIPYLCHFLLRLNKNGNRKLLTAHVIFTILLLFYFFFFIRLNHEEPRKFYDHSTWETFNGFGGLNKIFGITVVGFLLVQFSFILYTITRLLIRHKTAH